MSTLIARYPGLADQIPHIRAWTVEHVPADVADEVALVVTEAATNALRHSRSGLPSGTITVSIRPLRRGRVRVAVTDQGDLHKPEPEADRDGGRGLHLIHELATECGLTGGPSGHTLWAEFTGARRTWRQRIAGVLRGGRTSP
ncbi:ATP-binding protein [Actinomadura sp. 3N407]|uniref:ATP-binding protein n=1 Tax=Actinomadura sp. 3N407 TaxID=3457423 RepID=UPI003FCCFA4B